MRYLFALIPFFTTAELILDTPENAIKYIDHSYIETHKSQQQKLRKMIVGQNRVNEKIRRSRRQYKSNYRTMYLEKLRQLQREMMFLNEWRNRNIKENISSMKDYDKKFRDMESQIQKQNDLIVKLVYARSRRRGHRRNKVGNNEDVQSRRSRSRRSTASISEASNDASNDARLNRLEHLMSSLLSQKDNKIEKMESTINSLRHSVDGLQFSLDEANSRYEGVYEETKVLLENEFVMNETIIELQNRLDQTAVPSSKSNPAPLVPPFDSSVSTIDQYDYSSDEKQYYEKEIQILNDRITEMEIMLNQTSSYAAESAEKAKSLAQETKTGLDILSGQVIKNTKMNELSYANKEDLNKVENKMDRQAIQELNETVSDTVFMLDDRIEIQDQINSEIDTKVGTYEDDLFYLNSTLDTALEKVDDLSSNMNGLVQTLERFSSLYKKLEEELNLFKINATANMNTFDRTVDLSIDLLDRMGEFNDDIINRLDKLEEINYPDQITNSTDFDYLYEYQSSDSSMLDTDQFDPLNKIA